MTSSILSPSASELTNWLRTRIAGFLWKEGGTPLGGIAADSAMEKSRQIVEALSRLSETERERDDARRVSAARKTEIERLEQEFMAVSGRATAAEAERDEARGEVQRLEKLVYVPGVLKCVKCGCVLVTTNLHAETGQFSANNEPQKCPNGCGPMWRRTEREAGNELCDLTDSLAERAAKAEAERDQLRERLAQADAVIDAAMSVVFSKDLPMPGDPTHVSEALSRRSQKGK